ncbi:MAG: hypothetical protein ACI9KE_004222 [Polyangiales bacterium]|jgi:hypothetical protein
MGHSIQISPSGRAACRTCKDKIPKGELRFGEEVPSQFGSSGVQKVWHHIKCAAGTKGDLVGPALEAFKDDVPNRDELLELIRGSAGKGSKKAGALPNADLAPTGRAKCILCDDAIEKGSVRIAVEREIDTGNFTTKGAGYLHPVCVESWAEENEESFEDLLLDIENQTELPGLPPPLGDADPNSFTS